MRSDPAGHFTRATRLTRPDVSTDPLYVNKLAKRAMQYACRRLWRYMSRSVISIVSVCLTSSVAICSGKHSVAEYLTTELGFQRVAINSAPAPPGPCIVEHTTIPESYTFRHVDDLLEFVTPRWQLPWVITSHLDEPGLEKLLIRPFFLLISIDAPVSLRWQRYRARCAANGGEAPAFEDFVIHNDEQMFDPSGGLAHILDRAQLRLLNSSNSLETLHSHLRALNLSTEQRLRPGWDEYFMQLADLAAQRSNCMKRRVGCVVVRDKRVISTGYNGTPRNVTNCNEGGCPRCNGGHGGGAALSTCLCIHAEENALLEAGRERIREGATLYCNTSVSGCLVAFGGTNAA